MQHISMQYANQYITPETALKQSDQFVNEGSWDQALEVLVAALQNRRNKGNNQMLERLMVSHTCAIFGMTRPNFPNIL